MACEMFAAFPRMFCAILMDLLMPIMDGFSAIRYIRSNLGVVVPIVAISGDSDSYDLLCSSTREAGADHLLMKPIKESHLNLAFCLLKVGINVLEWKDGEKTLVKQVVIDSTNDVDIYGLSLSSP